MLANQGANQSFSRFLSEKEQSSLKERFNFKDKYVSFFWISILVFALLDIFFLISFILVFLFPDTGTAKNFVEVIVGLLVALFIYFGLFVPIQIALVRRFYNYFKIYLDLRSPVFLDIEIPEYKEQNPFDDEDLFPIYLNGKKYFRTLFTVDNSDPISREKVIEYSPRTKIIWRIMSKKFFESHHVTPKIPPGATNVDL